MSNRNKKRNNKKKNAKGQNENDEDASERKHWFDVMRAFLSYQDFLECDLRNRQSHLQKLPPAFFDRLPTITMSKLDFIRLNGSVNQKFFCDMIAFQYDHFFDFNGIPNKNDGEPIHISQMHRNQAVLHSLMREWSSEGADERKQCFDPIIAQLRQHVPPVAGSQKRILVPGCGVGRLPIEIAGAVPEYTCQGNEFSVYMILASNFMLNGVQQSKAYTIYPWLDKVCNVVNATDPLLSVQIPDVTAFDILNKQEVNVATSEGEFPKFSFQAGDFNQIYSSPSNKNQWDSIVTCFFIDTAPVVIDYISTIHHLLKPGGIWVNMGPLLYHWAENNTNDDPRYGLSIELSYEELKHVILGYGFEFVYEELNIPCVYSSDCNSMMYTQYRTVLFTIRKL